MFIIIYILYYRNDTNDKHSFINHSGKSVHAPLLQIAQWLTHPLHCLREIPESVYKYLPECVETGLPADNKT